MDYNLSASYYQKNEWDVIWPESTTIIVPPKDVAKVKINLSLPKDIQTGVYQGFITFEGDKHTVNAPISFVVKQPIKEKDIPILIQYSSHLQVRNFLIH